MRGSAGAVLAVFAATLTLDAAPAMAADCAASSSAADLDAFFGSDDAAGLAGADYPHAYALPDGRTLWLFQDAFIGDDDQLTGDRFAHNAALVQTGACFELLSPPGGRGNSWIGSWSEDDLFHWLWPLDAEIGADGHLWLFLAEVHNPRQLGAARGAQPLGTWRARYRLPDLELIDLEPAGDPAGGLYGYSIVSDDDWTYFYGHCYRQFDEDDPLGFADCSPFAYLARVPRGQLGRPPEYWSDDGWTGVRDDRTPVLRATQSMPVSVERFGDVYVAASDENDWYGSDIVVRTAKAPQGPWTEVLRYTAETKCGEDCHNYGAFILPQLEGDQVVIAHSNNAWDMRADAFSDASRYRIDVRAVTVPGVPGQPVVAATPSTIDDDSDGEEQGGGVTDNETVETVDPSEPAVEPTEVPALSPSSSSSGTDRVRSLLTAAGLGLVALIAGFATLGFAATLRRTNLARRRSALARVRAAGARREHRPSRPRAGPHRARRTPGPAVDRDTVASRHGGADREPVGTSS